MSEQVGAGGRRRRGRRRARGSGAPPTRRATARWRATCPARPGSDDPDPRHRSASCSAGEVVERPEPPHLAARRRPAGPAWRGRAPGRRAGASTKRRSHIRGWGTSQVGLVDGRARRPRARRRRACAGPTAPRGPARPSASRARHTLEQLARASSAVSSSATRLRYGALLVGPADGIGLVHGRDAPRGRAATATARRRWADPVAEVRAEPEEGPRPSAAPGDADARRAQLLGHGWPELAHRRR